MPSRYTQYAVPNTQVQMSPNSSTSIVSVAMGCMGATFFSPYSIRDFLGKNPVSEHAFDASIAAYGAPFFPKKNLDGTAQSNNANIPEDPGPSYSSWGWMPEAIEWGDYRGATATGQRVGKTSFQVNGVPGQGGSSWREARSYATSAWQFSGRHNNGYSGFCSSDYSSWVNSQISNCSSNNESAASSGVGNHPAPIAMEGNKLGTTRQASYHSSVGACYMYSSASDYSSGTLYIAVEENIDYNNQENNWPFPKHFLIDVFHPTDNWNGFSSATRTILDIDDAVYFQTTGSDGNPYTRFYWTQLSNPFQSSAGTFEIYGNGNTTDTTTSIKVYPII